MSVIISNLLLYHLLR